ncbi:MAG: hypothetical protein JJV99_08375 [Colwellia sp.]|nr:hypothetical protein [Colwellia sp.]
MYIMDQYSKHYESIIDDTYDCIDRLVLNSFFIPGHIPGGFRNWFRILTGNDENLTNTYLMRMAGRFGRRLRGFAKAHDIPVVDCKKSVRKDEISKEYIPDDPNYTGLFLILVNRAPGVVWHIQRGAEGGITHIVRKKPLPFINHYYFHIMDAEWGHIIIRMSGHPPFPAQIILNGHEYVSRKVSQMGLSFTKEDNCFTTIDNAHDLFHVADSLCSSDTIGRLEQVCERWIYSTCLCFALTTDEQQKTNFHYNYSVYQVEYCRNLLFQRGKWMDQVFESTIDRTRSLLDIRTVRTIFGNRKRSSQKGTYQVTVEKPVYNLTVFKVNYGYLTVKMYSKGERLLRIEVVAHSCKALHYGVSLDKFTQIIEEVKAILERFLSVLESVDVSLITTDTIQNWITPSQVGSVRVGGIDVNKERIHSVMKALISISTTPGGFTSSQLANRVTEIMDIPTNSYSPRQASYDLKKFRGKQLVYRIEGSHRYQADTEGIKQMVALLVLHEKVLMPLIDNSGKVPRGRHNKNSGIIDHHCKNIQYEMKYIFKNLNIAA